MVSWYHFLMNLLLRDPPCFSPLPRTCLLWVIPLVVNLSFEKKTSFMDDPNKVVAATICVVTFWRIVKHHSLDRAIFFYQNTTNWTCYSEKKVVKCKSAIHYIICVHAKGQLISEWLFGVFNSPKKQHKKLMNFCPRI